MDWIKLGDSRSKIIVLVIMALFLSFTVPLAATLNLWVDEAYSLETTNGGLHHAFERALDFEMQPPMYFLLLTLWRKIDDSVLFARLLSIIFVLAAVALSMAVGSRFLKQTPAWIPALIVAVNPITVYAALEIRIYSLVLLLSALMLLLFYDGYLSRDDNGKSRLLFITTSVIALYTHYFLGFILAGATLVVLLRRDWPRFKSYAMGMLVVGAAFLPMVFTVLGQVSSIRDLQVNEHTINILAGIKLLYRRIIEYILPKHWNEPGIFEVIRDWVFRSWILFGFIVIGRAWRRTIKANGVSGIFIILLVTVACFFVVRNILGIDLLKSYHTVVLLIPVTLSFILLFEQVGQTLVHICATVVVLFSVVSVAYTYQPMAKLGDWKRAADYVMDCEGKNEPIFLFRNEGILGFKNTTTVRMF